MSVKPFGIINRFEQLFEFILNISISTPITMIIDEFQEFHRINESIFSSIQKLWHKYKNTSKLHLVVCESTYSLMKKICEDAKKSPFLVEQILR